MYTEKDIKLLEEKYSKIDEEIKELILNNVCPLKDEIKNIYDTIMNFIKNKKRIIYGGTAQNALIKNVNVNDAIYGKNDYNDIDFYSPTPIDDLVELANLLHERKINNVYCRDALHEETFSLTVCGRLYCEVSYMPKFIFDNLPIIKVKKIKYIHPYIAMIDYLRMFTEPMFSSFRWIKSIKRFCLLQKYYKIEKKTEIIATKKNEDIVPNKVLNNVFNVISKKKVIFIDDYAYNYFMSKSESPKYIDINKYVIISFNFKEDVIDIRNKLQENSDIEYDEYYPFSQFLGRSIIFTYKRNKILVVYDYNEICVPSFKLKAISTMNNKISESSDDIYIGTFSLTILYYLIESLYLFVFREKNYEDNYVKIEKLISQRNNFFEKNKKNMLDNTIFRDFNTNCDGKTVSLQYKKRMSNRRRFKYEPGKDVKKLAINFNNTSGNIINNKKKSIFYKKDNE